MQVGKVGINSSPAWVQLKLDAHNYITKHSA